MQLASSAAGTSLAATTTQRPRIHPTASLFCCARRQAVAASLACLVVSPALAVVEGPPNALVEKLRAKSELLRDERKKERLDAYNVRNFKDYLSWELGGSGRNGPEAEAIRRWMEKNAD